MKRYIVMGMIIGALIIAVSAVTSNPKSSSAGAFDEFRPGQTMITLSATEQMDLKQDLLIASLRIEQDGKDAKTVQDKINQLMKQAVDIAKTEPTIKTSTGQYNVYSFDPNPEPKHMSPDDIKKRTIWRGSQTIDMQGKVKDKMTDVVGKIQGLGFAMNNMSYQLTPEQMEEYKDALMTKALEKINARAAKAAKALGKRKYDIVEVNIDGGPVMAQPMVMAKAVAMDSASAPEMASPVAEAADQSISMTVTARVMMRD